ncbi:MAG: right-handed parallel beta-helix repeat-containing protein [bacterium]
MSIKSTNYGIYCYNSSDPTISYCRIEAGGSGYAGVSLANTGSNPKIYHCTIIPTGNYSVYANCGTTSAKIAHCTCKKGFNNITNLIGTPYNVIDDAVE